MGSVKSKGNGLEKGPRYSSDDTFRISNIKKYLNADGTPRVDSAGNQLFERDVVQGSDLSSNAQIVLRALFKREAEMWRQMTH